ncbi:hypothetical protein Cgig2_003025 [Carnegiea gigantea]|uniref:NAC domain-containing protein n=1 Tax=Carnegiea gigantea TaxID=171969 RepID=A0A9Q1GXF6_9CARY|nr:hypothetical protein Cgig2_003025 [Carnegiea gigantea]
MKIQHPQKKKKKNQFSLLKALKFLFHIYKYLLKPEFYSFEFYFYVDIERCRIGSTPQNEWYFFSHKDRKYPTGSRTNRATNAGFWKATGRDKCIRNSFKKIGMRKTLVFYRGRAPHGQKTDWIMHEYRLEDGDDPQGNPSEDGWVVCRVFKKKNLFKVASGGGGTTSAASDQLLCNTTGSSGSTQSWPFIARDTNAQYHHHHHLLLRNDHQQTSTFDLYMNKPDLGLHSYSHPHQIPALPPPVPHSDYPHHLYQAAGTCETGLGLEVAACEPSNPQNQWAIIDRVVGHDQDDHQQDQSNSNTLSSTVHQMNQQQQLSLRGEMDFWGYAK